MKKLYVILHWKIKKNTGFIIFIIFIIFINYYLLLIISS